MESSHPTTPIGPLSVGNVVSAGVRIYRSHLKQYLAVSLVSFLWLLVPVYGWAKFSAVHGTISRHAFQELINQPESINDSRRYANRRMWSFMGVGFMTYVILVGLYIAFAIAFGIVLVLASIPIAINPAFVIFTTLVGIVGFVIGIAAIIRVYSRIFVAEVPLVMESDVDEAGSISRSWSLTKGAVGRIQWIVVVAFLVTLLLQLPSQIIAFLTRLSASTNPDSATLQLLAVLNLTLSLFSSALILPYWQVIKAVIYYDLRTRREGLGLQLRDR